jgi:SAM-dependent methyltransferase
MIQRLHCPITGHPAEVIFSRSYQHPVLRQIADRAGLHDSIADKAYEIRYCAHSELYFQTWVMSADELGGWYSPPADRSFFMSEIAKQKLHWFAHQTEEILVLRQLCPAQVPVVLDFGCNWGKWASMALAHGCEVYGVDVNRDASKFCASRGIRMISFEDLPGFQFDFINVDQVMEHLSEPLMVARHLSACVKPGGFIKFSTPNNPELPRQLRVARQKEDDSVLDPRTLDSLLPLEHVNLFNDGSLKLLAKQAGLLPYRLPFFKWLGAGQLWNVPRQLNRNLVVPFKRWRGNTTYQWFQKPLN